MPKRPDWRSASAVETLRRIDRAGFAWEFLRRNPRYRKDYNQIRKGAPRSPRVAEAVSQRWGLCFRLRSQACIGRCSSYLATRAGSPQRDPGLGID